MRRIKPISKAEISERALWIAADMLIAGGHTLDGGETTPQRVRRFLRGKARQELLKERRERVEMADIMELGLSDRARNALRRNGVETAEQLLKMTPGELYGLRGVGKQGYVEIMEKLQAWYAKKMPRTP